MISWIIIGMIVIIGLFLAKMRHVKHKFFIITILILVAFFYISASRIIGNENLDLSNFNGIMHAGKVYFVWLGNGFQNVKVLVGDAIKLDWVGNSTAKVSGED